MMRKYRLPEYYEEEWFKKIQPKLNPALYPPLEKPVLITNMDSHGKPTGG